MPVIAAERLRKMIAYNPDTGEMIWLARKAEDFPDQKDVGGWNSRHAGLPALAVKMPNGRKRGDILGRGYYAHRVAWAIHHGAWPTGEIDHINGDPSDNRIANLRDVDRKTNCRNMSNRRSGRGRTGVYYRPGVRRNTHGAVKHGKKEYAHYDYRSGETFHVNTVEGFWRLFKASIRSTHVQISSKHMQRYLSEFTFRASNRERVNGMFDLLVGAL